MLPITGVSKYKDTITPAEKAKQYLSEFSKEKAIDICETMVDVSKSLKSKYDVYYYTEVWQILTHKTP